MCKIQENYTAPRMVLSASGVEHEELLSVAEPLLSDLPSVPRSEEPKSVYVGGDFRRQSEAEACIRSHIVPFHITNFFIPFCSLSTPSQFPPNTMYCNLYDKICCKSKVHILLLLLKFLVAGKKRRTQ